jgi:hypothetical protein
MNQIIINGKSINVQGNNISVINDKVYVDGKLVESGLSGRVEISFKGDLANLKTDGSATVHGDVRRDVIASGSVKCHNVEGDVDASGSVNCGKIGGNVRASGSIRMVQ